MEIGNAERAEVFLWVSADRNVAGDLMEPDLVRTALFLWS